MIAAWRTEIENHASAMEAEAKEIFELLTELTVTKPVVPSTSLNREEAARTQPIGGDGRNRHHPDDYASLPSASSCPETDRLAALKSRLARQLTKTDQTASTNSLDRTAHIDSAETRS